MEIGIDARLWNESGVGRYTRNLIFKIAKIDKKNKYVLFVLKKDKEEIESYRLGGKWKIVIADIRWHSVEEQIKLPFLINKEKLDLVHFPYFSVPVFYNGPFVVTIHDLILHHFPTGEASTLALPLYQAKLLGYRFVISQAAKRAKKIIAVSNTTKNEILNKLGVDKDKIVVTYEGIDQQILNLKLQILNNSKNTKYKILNTKYILYVGNAYPHKNLERLIEAFSMIGDKGLMINLVLVGKEDYFYKRLREKVQSMKLMNHVIFYGKATDEELKSLYRNAQALIVPSLMEGFSLPALEGMANKCLVLASDIPALEEICKDAAIYFNPKSIEEIADKLKKVYLDGPNSFKENIAKGYKRIALFSWSKMAKQTLAIYEEVNQKRGK